MVLVEAAALAVAEPQGDGKMKKLDELLNNLEQTLKDNLVSVFIFGSQASVEVENLQSNINLMVILNELSAEKLQNISKPVSSWVKAKNPVPVIMDINEWNSSFDVYAMECMDIKEHHRILCGKDITSVISVKKDDLRLQCEAEVKNLFLKYRLAYMMDYKSNGEMQKLLNNMMKSFMVISRTVLRLNDKPVPECPYETISQSAALTGINAEMFTKILKVKLNEEKFSKEELTQTCDCMIEELAKLLGYTNTLANV